MTIRLFWCRSFVEAANRFIFRYIKPSKRRRCYSEFCWLLIWCIAEVIPSYHLGSPFTHSNIANQTEFATCSIEQKSGSNVKHGHLSDAVTVYFVIFSWTTKPEKLNSNCFNMEWCVLASFCLNNMSRNSPLISPWGSTNYSIFLGKWTKNVGMSPPIIF